MCKKALAVFALCFAVLGGCAANGGGDLVGTSAFDAYDGSGSIPRGVVLLADG